MTLYNNYFARFKEKYLMLVPITIILQSCLGSAAVMYVLMNGNEGVFLAQLFIIVCICMIYNASVLAQLNLKTIFNLLIASIVVNSLIIILNLL